MGDKVQFARKTAADNATDDEVVEVMRSHKEGQSGGCPQDLPKTEGATKAAAAAKAEPDGKPKSKSGAVAKGAKRSGGKQSGAQLDLHRGEIGGWYRHSSGPNLCLDIPQRRQDFPGRPANPADGAQVPNNGPADLLLPTWT